MAGGLLAKSTGLVLAEKPSVGIEPTNLPDRSRHGHHGTHTDVTMVQLPSGLWVRSLNGTTSFITLSGPTLDEIKTGYTALIWVRSGGAVASQEFLQIGELTTGAYASGFFFRMVSDGTLFFRHNYGVNENDTYTTVATYDDDAFHLVGQSWDGTDVKRFIAGVEVDSEAIATFDITSEGTEHRLIGRSAWGSTFGDYLDGEVALPKIFSRALSAGKIKQIYEVERHLFGR